jgi:hypothetical protein
MVRTLLRSTHKILLYAQGGQLSIAELLDYVIVLLISAYGIAFFGGHLKQSKTSPALIWVNNKYPQAPKYLVYIGIFVFSFNAFGLIKALIISI